MKPILSKCKFSWCSAGTLLKEHTAGNSVFERNGRGRNQIVPEESHYIPRPEGGGPRNNIPRRCAEPAKCKTCPVDSVRFLSERVPQALSSRLFRLFSLFTGFREIWRNSTSHGVNLPLPPSFVIAAADRGIIREIETVPLLRRRQSFLLLLQNFLISERYGKNRAIRLKQFLNYASSEKLFSNKSCVVLRKAYKVFLRSSLFFQLVINRKNVKFQVEKYQVTLILKSMFTEIFYDNLSRG